MSEKELFQKLIVITNFITKGQTTALIEIGADAKDFAITTLDGEYHTAQEFEDALEAAIQAVYDDEPVGDVFNFFPMNLSDAYALYGAIAEVLEAAKEAEARAPTEDDSE